MYRWILVLKGLLGLLKSCTEQFPPG